MFYFSRQKGRSNNLGGLIVTFVFSLYYVRQISKLIVLHFKWEYIKYILTYSLPLVPYSLSGVILVEFDRIIINNKINSSAAGLYSFAYSIGMILTLMTSAIQASYYPAFAKLFNKKEYEKISYMSGKLFYIEALCAMALILFGKEFGLVLGPKEFHNSLFLIPIIVMGYVFFAMFYKYLIYIDYMKKTIFSSIIVLTSGVTNIILNVIYIPKYGYAAGAWTTAISYFIMFLLAWVVAKLILGRNIVPVWVLSKPTLILLIFSILLFYLEYDLKLNYAMLLGLKILSLFLFSTFVVRFEMTNKLKKIE